MPGVVVHTLLGADVLDGWRARPARAPFPAESPDLRATFLAGCMGPDMGLMPGGDTLFSDAAHYVRTGELARALLGEARTDAERAFAWGWAAHVLADVLVHPLINALAGESRGGGRPLTFADDPGLHVAVEVGVEGYCFGRWEARRPYPGRRPEAAALLGRAYAAMYGAAVGPRRIGTSLRAWGRWGRTAVAVGAAAAGHPGLGGQLFAPAYRATRAVTALLRRRSLSFALTHPLAPSASARERVDAALADFAPRFEEHFRDGLRSLADYNLDTGAVEGAAPYPLTARTLARLGRPA